MFVQQLDGAVHFLKAAESKRYKVALKEMRLLTQGTYVRRRTRTFLIVRLREANSRQKNVRCDSLGA